MSRKNKEKIFYYESESTDFLKMGEGTPSIDGNYEYIKRGLFDKVRYFVYYRLIATPVAFLYTKLRFGERYVGRGKIRAYLRHANRTGSSGAFLVGNHTQPVADAFTPNMLSYPTRNYTVIHPSNLNMPVLGGALVYLGGLPTPTSLKGARGFSLAVEECIKDGKAVTLYPEAHVWPFFTGVRHIEPEALRLAARLGAGVFTFTRVYRRRLFGIGCTVYVDGPFFAQADVGVKEGAETLARRIEEVMKKRSEGSVDTGYRYVKKDQEDKKAQEDKRA
jgi:1-acyl-sn-glycerol-3-phosphate acyltransferase